MDPSLTKFSVSPPAPSPSSCTLVSASGNYDTGETQAQS